MLRRALLPLSALTFVCIFIATSLFENVGGPTKTGSTEPSSSSPHDSVPKGSFGFFDVSMKNSPACAAAIRSPALNAWADQIANHHVGGRGDLGTSVDHFREALEACHGPFPLEDARLNGRAWLEGVLKCGDPEIQLGGHPGLFGGEWCIGGWRDRTRPAVAAATAAVGGQSSELSQRLLESARCALHLEFPLVPADPRGLPSAPLGARRPPGWRPPRTLLLALTLGDRGSRMGCGLLKTALPRGWDVVLAEGPFEGLSGKYSAALKALDLALGSDVSDGGSGDGDDGDDALVVFVDSSDVLAQQSPRQVAEAFLAQPYAFVWSAEDACFPLGTWPFDLGLPGGKLCDLLFPGAGGVGRGPSLRDGPQFVNTGGWIGTARAARSVLRELSALVAAADPLNSALGLGSASTCYQAGTDQLLGNAAFLRHRSLLGLDASATFFASSPPQLLEEGRLKLVQEPPPGGGEGEKKGTKLPAYCYEAEGKPHCPAFLHFNGGAYGDGPYEGCLAKLESPRQQGGRGVVGAVAGALLSGALGGCAEGSLTVVNTGTGKVATGLNEDPSLWPCGAGKRPRLCAAGKAARLHAPDRKKHEAQGG